MIYVLHERLSNHAQRQLRNGAGLGDSDRAMTQVAERAPTLSTPTVAGKSRPADHPKSSEYSILNPLANFG